MVQDFIHQVFNPARLAALRRLGILDTPVEAAFDRLGALAARVLKTPIALVTLVDDTRQFFKSCQGLPEPWASWRHTPLSHSFCQHVLTTSNPLVIPDARVDPRFSENLAIRDLGVVAYLGIPLVLSGGEVLGSFCVIDHVPRDWTTDDIHILSVIAASVMTEIELRSEIGHKKSALEEVERLNRELSRKSESLETARQELETFNCSLFHDLRSPVATVSAFTHLFRESASAGVSAEGMEYLRRISDGATRIERIMDGLSLLSGMSRARMQLEDVDLTEMAEKILAAEQATEPDRRVTLRIQPALRARADCQLAQVALENLLHNAWKFTGKTPEAQIEFGETIIGNERVFFVRDNGAGFDQTQSTRLFVPFERLHSKRDFAGTGLGLTTVKRIIDRHGGRIWAESETNRGTTFYFTLEPAPEPATVVAA
jgi:signal transduction histidine kinase